MQNENQPQDFETFGLLFDENLHPSENLGAPFKSFLRREQSFVSQILDYMHAPGKEGFFPHLFLGNAVALLSTKLNAEKIYAKKIYYRFDGAKTLKLVVATSKDGKNIKHIYPFIFTENIKEHYEGQEYSDKFEFTKSEIDSVIESIKKDKSISAKTLQGANKNKFTLIEVLKNNYALKMQASEPKDNDMKPKEVYVYKKGNSLYFKAKNIRDVIKNNEIKIGKEEDKLDIKIEIFTQYLNKKTRLEIKPKIKDFLSRKGFHCKKNSDDPLEPQADSNDGFSAIENNVTVSVYKKNVTDKQSTKKFEEITYRLELREIERQHTTEKYTYLEDYITKLSTAGNFRIKNIFEKILAYVQQSHSGLRIDNHAYGSGAREANQHAFLAGIFQMDRYRDNTRIFIEQLAGRGFADTILLPLGSKRVSNSIPIVIEHKAEGKDAPNIALGQSKEYAKGFQPNRARFLTTAEQALCTGINLDYKTVLIQKLFNIIENKEEGKRLTVIKSKAKQIIDNDLKNDNLRHFKDNLDKIINEYKDISNKRETKEKILGVLTFNSEVVDIGIYKIRPIIEDILNEIHKETGRGREIQKYVKEQLERTYYAFPGTRYGRNNHCFSRFLLGYASSINDSEYKKYVFFYDELSIIKTDSGKKKYNDEKNKDESHAIATIVFISQELNHKVVVMNLVEGDEEAHKQFKQRKFAKNTLEGLEVGSKEIVEINLFFDILKKGSEYKFSDFFMGFENENRIVEHNDLNQYDKYHEYHNDINGEFEKMFVPEGFNKEIEKLLANPSTHKDFFKQIGKIIFPFKNLIKNEYDFQAVLDGIFGAYSDKNKSVVLTEYQTGLGNRIDMIIHQKGNPIVGLELKIANKTNSEEMLKTAERQIKGKYEKSVTYKVLEDIDPKHNTAELISVVFVSDASSEKDLIKCSENIISVELKRSSVATIPHKEDSSALTVSQAPGSGRKQKTPRDYTSTTQPEKSSKQPKMSPAAGTNQQKTAAPMEIDETFDMSGGSAANLRQALAATTTGEASLSSSRERGRGRGVNMNPQLSGRGRGRGRGFGTSGE